jgi:protein TonB
VGGKGDVRAGTADGVPGGRVGGRGDGAFALSDVAVPPVLVQRVIPDYPRHARRSGTEGEVVLEVVVDRRGRVARQVRVLDSAPLFDDAAIDAVRRWRFRPARDARGTAVAVVMEVPLRFVLEEGARR